MQHRSTVICLISCCIFHHHNCEERCVCGGGGWCFLDTQVMHIVFISNLFRYKCICKKGAQCLHLALWLQLNVYITRYPELTEKLMMDFHHRYQPSQCHSCFVRLVWRLWINPWRSEIKPSFFERELRMMHVQISWLQDEEEKKKIKPWMKACAESFQPADITVKCVYKST